MSLEHSPARQAAPRKRGRKPRAISVDIFADRWLTPDEAAAFLGVAVQSLAHDRVSGDLGIEYAKFKHSCRYKLSTLQAWSEARVMTPGRGRAA